MAVKYLVLRDGIPRIKNDLEYYDESMSVGATITAGTNVTLPASGTYSGTDLEVYLNNIRLEDVEDYTFVGSPPRTQVQFTFDLEAGDTVRFRIIT